jgi:hypothetical protein
MKKLQPVLMTSLHVMMDLAYLLLGSVMFIGVTVVLIVKMKLIVVVANV